MATTSMWRVKGDIGKLLKYAGDEGKTAVSQDNDSLEDLISYTSREDATQLQKFVTGINCSIGSAKKDMMEVKKLFGKTGGTIAYHGYQSFAEGEVTPELAHSIGVSLATELWGNRYQVLVATHLDKESHLHNHFVINTVSFVDGKKFHRTKRDYAKMQEVSDRLCKEAGLSVLTNPGGKTKSYSEWLAENEGRPTVRGSIRNDIDDAITSSVTANQFMEIMKAKGYEFKLYTESGALLKYPGIKPPGAKGFFRFHKLGQGYTLDDIWDRILSNNRPKLPFSEPVKTPRRVYSKRPKRKLHGLYALYIRYCYELHIIVKNPKPRKLHFELREDAIKLSKLDEQTRFMAQNSIMTVEDVTAHKNTAELLITSLAEERRILRNSLKTASRKGNEDQIKEIKAHISQHTEKIKILRKDVKLCDEIQERAENIKIRIDKGKEYRLGSRDDTESKDAIIKGRERNDPSDIRSR